MDLRFGIDVPCALRVRHCATHRASNTEALTSGDAWTVELTSKQRVYVRVSNKGRRGCSPPQAPALLITPALILVSANQPWVIPQTNDRTYIITPLPGE